MVGQQPYKVIHLPSILIQRASGKRTRLTTDPLITADRVKKITVELCLCSHLSLDYGESAAATLSLDYGKSAAATLSLDYGQSVVATSHSIMASQRRRPSHSVTASRWKEVTVRLPRDIIRKRTNPTSMEIHSLR
ncbi:hypothetical protein PISMIDRAFT_409871 [Pisolithus microcarpus 441]|uniref:Unplaced genomic scaffold scaffold_32, whole genome shotgun sequence n=1 Tax=Pisolithus microcarpus 441 TaxID=765257 RepID=A0A0C9ZQ79_9AGAM|nr:hypothetical protein PISMIDRAFT_409871 [Pisolithus microcarpus 441]